MLKHILASMNYFDSDMSKSTNTVVYFDWKTVIYIYVCGQCRTQLRGENQDLLTRSNPNQAHDRSLSWVGTSSSIKSGKLELDYCAHLIKMI
jgi:hypothetical protein